MTKPLASYAIVGDTRTTALVADDGSIDWWCPARHDGAAVLTRLLDEDGGAIEMLGSSFEAAGRRYESDTNVLQTDLRSATGLIRLTDFMVVHALPDATTGPDGHAPGILARIVQAVEGETPVEVHVRLRPDYGRMPVKLLAQGRHVLASCGEQWLRITGSHALAVEDDRIVMRCVLARGDGAFVGIAAAGADDELSTMEGVDHLLNATRAYWRRWSSGIRYTGGYSLAVRRSALALKLLTYAPTGAIVAAATTSLPEAVPGERNYDYRYCWTRDASFTVTAFCKMGLVREASEFLRFLIRVGAHKANGLKLLYGIDGEVPEEQTLANLPGWRGVGPVRVGNAASGQEQHDIHGELMIALHAFLDAVDFVVPAYLAPVLGEMVRDQAASALRHRGDADHGIWELRSETIQSQHSKALLWAALDRAVRIAGRIGGFSLDEVANWRRGATDLRAEYESRTWSEAKQAWTRDYDSDLLDAAVLRTALFGALDPKDPRMVTTLRAVETELGVGDLIYRYRYDDGLEGDEATFTACAFWRVGVLALADRFDEARRLIESLLGRSNDVGLFAEEIDAATGEQRGNLPQAFTHMCVINHAIRVDEAGARVRASNTPKDRNSNEGDEA